jgi:hypothetical protein
MNKKPNIRWALLFGLTILLPAGGLTVMVVRTLVNEDRNALVDLQARVPALQAHFDAIVNAAIDSARLDVPYDLPVHHPVVLFGFRLDEEGRIVHPRYEPLSIRARDDSFGKQWVRGYTLEFEEEDPVAAIAVYKGLLADSEPPFLRAEALNLIGRAALSNGQLETVRVAHDSLSNYLTIFDADGSHPFSISVLRLAGVLEAQEATNLIVGWLEYLLKGDIPLFTGVTQYLKVANRLAMRKLIGSGVSDQIYDKIREVRTKVRLIEAFGEFKTAGSGPEGTAFLSGMVRDGSSGLIYTHPDGWGFAFDLKMILKELEKRLPSLYAVRLFDLAGLPEIERRTSNFVRVVSPPAIVCFGSIWCFTRGIRSVCSGNYNRSECLQSEVSWRWPLLSGVASGCYIEARFVSWSLRRCDLILCPMYLTS